MVSVNILTLTRPAPHERQPVGIARTDVAERVNGSFGGSGSGSDSRQSLSQIEGGLTIFAINEKARGVAGFGPWLETVATPRMPQSQSWDTRGIQRAEPILFVDPQARGAPRNRRRSHLHRRFGLSTCPSGAAGRATQSCRDSTGMSIVLNYRLIAT